jgi:hypothetical protein
VGYCEEWFKKNTRRKNSNCWHYPFKSIYGYRGRNKKKSVSSFFKRKTNKMCICWKLYYIVLSLIKVSFMVFSPTFNNISVIQYLP